jgi:hypothetical protein
MQKVASSGDKLVQVVHGPYSEGLPLGGRSIAEVKHSLRELFNIGYFAKAFLNGRLVTCQHVVHSGDTLEFVRAFGVKGGMDQPPWNIIAAKALLVYDEELRSIADTVRAEGLAGDESIDRTVVLVTAHFLMRYGPFYDDAESVSQEVVRHLVGAAKITHFSRLDAGRMKALPSNTLPSAQDYGTIAEFASRAVFPLALDKRVRDRFSDQWAEYLRLRHAEPDRPPALSYDADDPHDLADEARPALVLCKRYVELAAVHDAFCSQEQPLLPTDSIPAAAAISNARSLKSTYLGRLERSLMVVRQNLDWAVRTITQPIGQDGREMAWDETLNELRQVLADLYPGPPETRVLLETAGVPTGKVLLEAAAQTRWHNALREAHLQGNIEAILSAAQAEYGSHHGLRAAAAAYRAKHRPDQPRTGSGAVAGTDDPAVLGAKSGVPPSRCDLAIVTAMPDELDPLFRLTGGKETWRPFPIDRFVHYHKTLDFDGQVLDVVAVSLWRYGDTPTAGAVHRLKQLHPQMLAMTGICAGWEGKDGIEFGDVIIAEGGFHPGEGKQQGTKFQPDTHLHLSPAWVVQQAKDSLSDQGWIGMIETERLRSLRYQGEWLVCQVGAAGFRLDDPDWDRVRAEKIEYSEALDWLRRHDLLDDDGKITATGKALLERRKIEGSGECKPRPDREKPTAHVGAFASAALVIAVEAPFKQPAAQVRSTRAYDLEVRTFLQAAAEIGIPAVADKGVTDYGTTEKDDHYRRYAAEAAACWLLAFVRKYSRFWAAESAK